MNRLSLIKQALSTGAYTISSLVCAIFISWVVLASVDFTYPWLHDSLNIEQHTLKYGPQNRYRDNFENTNRDERIRLFSAINTSIHDHGHGLAEIEYFDKNTQTKINTLLHTSEILHLTDVSYLIDLFRITALASFLLWLGLILQRFKRSQLAPNIKQQSLSTLSIIILFSIIILIIGPVNVFYAFHELLFPANHKWFFYYQESLMTILMKAPTLFGYIAILITLLSIPIFIIMNAIASKILEHYQQT